MCYIMRIISRLNMQNKKVRFITFFLFYLVVSFINSVTSQPVESQAGRDYSKYYQEHAKGVLTSAEFEELLKRSNESLDIDSSQSELSRRVNHIVNVKTLFFVILSILLFLLLSKFYRYKQHDIYFISAAVFLGNIIFLSLFETALYVISFVFFMLLSIRRRKWFYRDTHRYFLLPQQAVQVFTIMVT